MISVVIPTLDEEQRLPACLAALAGQAPHELIVVDGGSSDRTVDLAVAAGARVLAAPHRGRAQQLNYGAGAAGGEILMFLHADVRLPAGALARAEQALADRPDAVAGSFSLLLDHPGLLYRVLSAAGNTVHRLWPTLYGDRAPFVWRRAFAEAGRFRPLPIMEDVDLSDRLHRLGQLVEVRGPVLASARDFERRGPLRLTAMIVIAVAAQRLRVSPRRIARFYYGDRSTTEGR